MQRLRWLAVPIALRVLTLPDANAYSRSPPPRLWLENDGGLSADHLTNGKDAIYPDLLGNFDMRELVRDHPGAMAFADEAASASTHARLSYWLGTIPSAVALGAGIGFRNTPTIAIASVTLVGSILLTFHFNSNSRHFTYKAINLYNGVHKSEESPKKSADVSFGIDAIPIGTAPAEMAFVRMTFR